MNRKKLVDALIVIAVICIFISITFGGIILSLLEGGYAPN